MSGEPFINAFPVGGQAPQVTVKYDIDPAFSKRAQIENAFTYHAPKPEQQPKYAAIRDKAKELALLIADMTPVSREQSLALTELEYCVMMANAAIARNT